MRFLDGQGTRITLDTITGEDLNVNDSTFGTGWYTQGGIFNVAGLLAEDRAQQFFFRSQLGLAFRSDLTDQMSPAPTSAPT